MKRDVLRVPWPALAALILAVAPTPVQARRKVQNSANAETNAQLYEQLRAQGQNLYRYGEYPAAERYLLKAVELARISVPGSRALAFALSDLAQVYSTWRRMPEAERLYQDRKSVV